MEFFTEYSLFFLKTLTFVVAILLVFIGILSLGRRSKSIIQIDSLNEAYHDKKKQLQQSLHLSKADKKQAALKQKKENKQQKEIKETKPTRFVLTFDGDITASQVNQLRNEISMILSVATPKDEVVIRLESPGGAVSGYGLATSQLERLREKHIPLTICIDKVAASGGYLMACVANTIIAAPFAMIGSIGVVAQIPNFHRFLKKNDIDVEQMTAGKYKRTLTMIGENTDEGREKFKEDLEAIHKLFSAHVLTNRSQVDIERVSTGEHWLARDAVDLGLIDILQTSDDYLHNDIEKFNTLILSTPVKQPLSKKLMKPLTGLLNKTMCY